MLPKHVSLNDSAFGLLLLMFHFYEHAIWYGRLCDHHMFLLQTWSQSLVTAGTHDCLVEGRWLKGTQGNGGYNCV